SFNVIGREREREREQIMELLQNVAAILLAVALVVLAILPLKLRKSAARRDSCFPPGRPGSWPLLGHLPFLGTGCPHHVLAHLARRLGPPPQLQARQYRRLQLPPCQGGPPHP
ncbi:hypothetical protein GOP47_0020282, partial [Adiantum capillus-veneris]